MKYVCLHLGEKQRHFGIPVSSAHKVNLQRLEDVGPWKKDKLLIKLHGTL